VRFFPGTRVLAHYAIAEAREPFFCSYGMNPDYRAPLERAGLAVSGVGEDGRVPRVIELSGHPFFLGTLYVPQARSRPEAPHPLVAAFVAAGAAA